MASGAIISLGLLALMAAGAWFYALRARALTNWQLRKMEEWRPGRDTFSKKWLRSPGYLWALRGSSLIIALIVTGVLLSIVMRWVN
ncbi:MAG: hypothetical protein ABUS57_05050 [Pseudomonadota bacterium]